MRSFMNNRDADERARELLSSYLDGHCTPAEKAFVEERLAQSQVLREELDELRMTVDTLHRLPEVPLPRTFYITEAMLEERKPRPLFSWVMPVVRGLRVASGAVALSLVSVLLLAVFTQNAMQPASTSAPASAPAPAYSSAQASPEAQKNAPQVGGAQAPQPTPAAASGTTPEATQQDTGQAPPAAASSPASSSATQTSLNSTTQLAPPSTPTVTNREMQPAGAAPRASPTPEPERVQTLKQPNTTEPLHESSGINLWEVAGGLAVLLLILLLAQALIARRV